MASEAKLESWPLALERLSKTIDSRFPYATASIGVAPGLRLFLSLLLLYPIWRAIYNIYFHPLSSYPGPRFAAATKIPIAIAMWKGDLPHWLLSLHEYYRSDIVRIAPDELAIISASAWQDAYASRPGHAHFSKELTTTNDGMDEIVTADEANHSRYRRVLSHAFSDRALREQEPLLMIHINKLICGLKRQINGTAKGKVDFTEWFTWTTFDIIGDLSFGQSFDCLANEGIHSFLAIITQALRALFWINVTRKFPPLGKLLIYGFSKADSKAAHTIRQYPADQVNRRLERETSRHDFLHYLTKHNTERDKGGMTRPEIQRNATTIIIAGSETTSTILTATVWLLMRHPKYYERLRDDIRAQFSSAGEINHRHIIDRVPFLQAVVDETFRIFPPTGSSPRVSPKGGEMVSGHFIPENTIIQIHPFAASRTHLNFDEPDVFAPERWMDPAEKSDRWKNDQINVVQPFSVGPRNCIGKYLAWAEMRLVLTHLLYNFDIESCDETDEQWTAQKQWFTWARKPMVVKLSNRAQ